MDSNLHEHTRHDVGAR